MTVRQAANRFGPVLLVVVLAATAYQSGAMRQLSFEALTNSHGSLTAYVAAHPLLSIGAYVAVFAAAVTLCLPAAFLLTLAGGLLFGLLEGGLGALAGSTIGGTVIFLICRTAVGDGLKRLAGPRVLRLQDSASRNAFALMMSVRLIPMMPFWLVNIGAAVLGVPLRVFVVTSLLGIAPSSFIYAGLGAGLGGLLAAGARPSMHMLIKPQVLIPLAALAVLALAPVAYRKLRGRSPPA